MIWTTAFLTEDELGVPLIGWHNVVTAVETREEAAGFPASNLLNPATHLLWKATSWTTQQLALTCSEESNYIAIAGHNFSRIGMAFTENPYAATGTLQSLLHFETGGDGTQTFQDRSGFGHGWQPAGNVQNDTAQFKFGSQSCLFDGTGDYLRTDGLQFIFSTVPFTIDFWVRLATTGTEKTLVDTRATEPSLALLLRITTGNVLQLRVNGTNQITGATALTTGTWYHVALTRSGTSTKLWLNGAQQGSTYSDSNSYIASTVVHVGADFLGANAHNGWIDEFRLLNGVAAWNAAFTPPTTAYADGLLPAIGAYELLLHLNGTDGSTTFTDEGGYDHVVTAHGNAQLDTAQFKFSTASLLLDGAGDFITLDGSEDFTFNNEFTLDFWVRFNSVTGVQVLADWRPFGAAGGLDTFLIYKFSDNTIRMDAGTVGIVGGTLVTSGVWYHIALTRANGGIRLFLDGIQQGSTLVTSITFVAGANRPAFGISADAEVSLPLNGWLDEIRIIKGIALWSQTFVPASVPVGTYARDYTRPIDDTRPIILRHSGLPASTSIVIKAMSDTDIPQAAVLYAGMILQMEHGVKWDVQHKQLPHARRSSIVSGMSESGNFLGRVVLNEYRESSAAFAYFTPDWYRENFEPFAAAAVSTPFFWAWNPNEYPEETSFAWLTDDIQPETDPATHRVHVTFSMRSTA